MNRTFIAVLFVLGFSSAFVHAEFIDYAVTPDSVCIELSDPELVGDILLNGEPATILASGKAQAVVKAVGPGKIYAGDSVLDFEPFAPAAKASAKVTVRVQPVPGKPGHAKAHIESDAKEELLIIVPPPGRISGGSVWMRTETPVFIPVEGPPGAALKLEYVTPDGTIIIEPLVPAEPVVEEPVSMETSSDKWWWIGGGLIAAGGGAAVIANNSSSSSDGGSSGDGGGSGSSGGGSSGGDAPTCSEGDFLGTWTVPGAEAEFGYAIGITFGGGGSAFMFADDDGGGEWSLDGCTISVSSGVAPFESCSTTVSPGATSMTLCGMTLVK